MRLRIMELPIQPTQDSYRRPWILIVDDVKHYDQQTADQFKTGVSDFGAEGILVIRERVELEPIWAGVPE